MSKLNRLTVLTGPTGSGKTTLLTQLSLDFAMQGVPTLWGSFELKNEVILSNMMYQLSGAKVDDSEALFDHWANELEKLPLYFQSFFGSTELDKVLSLIDYCIYAYDVAHIILDNLQFMLSGQGRGFERFELQDDLIAKLRKIATERNVHITLVIHPKKTEDNQDLHVSSIFGTSKSTQEADNIIIIQNRNKYKVIDIKKNRFDGEVGKAAVIFDKELKRFYQINNADTESLYNGKEAQEIVKVRRALQKTNSNTTEAQAIKPHANDFGLFTEPTIAAYTGFSKYKSNTGEHFSSYSPRNRDDLLSHKTIVSRSQDEIKADSIASMSKMNDSYFGNSALNNAHPIDPVPPVIEYEMFAIDAPETDESKNNAHIKWTMDNTNEPNFFKQGDVIYTYDDIINELTSNGNKKGSSYKSYNKSANKFNGNNNNRSKYAQEKSIEDELLENLDR